MKHLNYWRRLLRLFYHYQKKSSLLPYFPVRLWVELTSFCNYRCIMCPNQDLARGKSGFMGFEVFKKILDEAEGLAFDINLAHRGESFLHPQLIEMIRYAKEKKFYTRLHTNGSLLTKDLSHKIIQAGLDRLSFSFDGYDKETYERIRKGSNFEKTVSNIVRFLEVKKEAGSKKPEASIEVINFNAKDPRLLSAARDEFNRRFKGLPLDSFVSKELHNWAGETGSRPESKKYSLCPFPWNALVIFWDGSVLPCTQDFFGHLVLGNIKEETLREIWNGERLVCLRKNLAAAEIQEIKTCSKCDRVWRRRFLGVPREYLLKFIAKRMP